MVFGEGKKKNGGFTVIEVLAVSAIMMILMAFGFVETVKHSRVLKVTEMDNMAREIYLAAENRAVLLAKSGQLEDSVKTVCEKDASGNPETLKTSSEWYIKYYPTAAPTADLKDLMPKGVIDPTLRESSFYIVYDVDAGCVRDVFYDEESSGENLANAFIDTNYGGTGGTGTFKSFYAYWKGTGADISRETRARRERYIGYYGGVTVTPGSAFPTPVTPPETPSVAPTITIENGEELTLTVNYKPVAGWKLKVTLAYDGRTVILTDLYPSGVVGNETDGTAVNTKNRDWTLDTLAASGDYKKQFKDWPWSPAVTTPSFGKNFSVRAVMVNEAGEEVLPVFDGANSLFADGSGGDKAYIRNLRHLQNLDSKFSKAGGKKYAVQVANIDASKLKDNSSSVINPAYEFKPIENTELISYEAYLHTIENLKVTSDSAKYTDASGHTVIKPGAGLFAEARTASSFTFKNVRLIDALITVGEIPAGGIVGSAAYVEFNNCYVKNASVDNTGTSNSIGGIAGTATTANFDNCRAINVSVGTLGGSNPAGGIAGTATTANFDNCRVYWDNDKVDDLKASGITYKICGTNAGGLAGELNGGTITGSFAASTVKGSANIGGLIGSATGTVNIETSYADCYLTGSGSKAGGLIGSAAASVNITNAYSAGFTESVAKSGGLVGNGSAKLANVYAAVYHDKTTVTTANIDSLAGTVVSGSNYYFLRYGDRNDWPSDSTGKSYNEMTDPNFVSNNLIGSGFDTEKKKEDATAEEKKSHPYRIKNSGLKNYSFPGLDGLPHYGDWKKNTPEVRIINAEELVVEVTYIDATSAGVPTPNLKLIYDGKYVMVPNDDRVLYNNLTPPGSNSYKWTWTLDTLRDDGPRFKNCKDWAGWSGTTPKTFGGDFSVEASVTIAGSYSDWSTPDTNNSLFAYAYNKKDASGSTIGAYVERISEDGTINIKEFASSDLGTDLDAGKDAYILNLRHLQNLDSAFSYVDGKKHAYQIDDINAKYLKDIYGHIVNNDYQFQPIDNGALKYYKSLEKEDTAVIKVYYSISNLKVTDDSTSVWGAGLFAAAENAKYENIYLKNVNIAVVNKHERYVLENGTTVKKNEYIDIGSVIGSATNCELINCKLEGASVIRGKVRVGGLAGIMYGTSTFKGCIVNDGGIVASGDLDIYGNATGGNIAGGMLGYTWGIVQFIRSNEADSGSGCKVDKIKVSGTTYAGGLVGAAEYGSGNIKFSGCYVGKDSDVTVKGNIIGGLAGAARNAGGEVTVTNCSVVNAHVNCGAADWIVGGLIGEAINANFDKSSVGVLLNTDANGNFTKDVAKGGYVWITQGNRSGGLVGNISSNAEQKTIQNCYVKNVDIQGTTEYDLYEGKVGGLAGVATGVGFYECSVDKITVTNNSFPGTDKENYTGGLAGSVGNYTNEENTVKIPTKFEECTAQNITVTGGGKNSSTGGVAGSAQDVEFVRCTAVGITVNGGGNAGGFVGGANGTKFTECKFTGKGTGAFDVKGEKSSGGLVGFTEASYLTNCWVNKADVQSSNEAGGLVGSAMTTIFVNCTVGLEGTGDDKTDGKIKVIGKNSVGGLVGFATADEFQNCYAVNATVTGKIADNKDVYGNITRVFGNVGGIAGSAIRAKFDKCSIYWKNNSDLTKKDASGTDILDYKITGTTAGGIVGAVIGGGTIKNSFAATLIKGEGRSTPNEDGADIGAAGGLAGELQKETPPKDSTDTGFEDKYTKYSVTIENSYADCYLSGVYTGGLIGANIEVEDKVNANANTKVSADLYLKNVYAAGFIDQSKSSIPKGVPGTATINNPATDGKWVTPKFAAGLCGGFAPVKKITNAYTAMNYKGDFTSIAPLVEQVAVGGLAVPETETNSVYWLNYVGIDITKISGVGKEDNGKSYAEMQNVTMGGAFGKKTATASDEKDKSIPYNLYPANGAGTITLTDYPFPGLIGMPHYGDWLANSN